MPVMFKHIFFRYVQAQSDGRTNPNQSLPVADDGAIADDNAFSGWIIIQKIILEVIAFFIVSANSAFRQAPDVIMLVHANIVNNIVRKRIGISAIRFENFELRPIKPVESVKSSDP